MFGQLAILTRSARLAEVQAIAPCTLLTLDENRFRQLLVRSPAVREAVKESAIKRAISPDAIEELTTNTKRTVRRPSSTASGA